VRPRDPGLKPPRRERRCAAAPASECAATSRLYADPVTDQGNIWEYWQTEGVHSFAAARPRLDYIAREVEKIGGSSQAVLTVGVGDGYLERRLIGNHLDVSAVDPSALAVEKLSAEGVKAIQGVLEQLPFEDHSFDVVVASEVLEHLTQDQAALAMPQIRRVLRNGGWFIGTVPSREVLADHTYMCTSCGHRDHAWGHRRSFSKDDLSNELLRHFRAATITTRAFPDFERRGLTNRVKSTVRWLMGRAGMVWADPKLFFAAQA
jgi:SAM-dependent methyltransferase